MVQVSSIFIFTWILKIFLDHIGTCTLFVLLNHSGEKKSETNLFLTIIALLLSFCTISFVHSCSSTCYYLCLHKVVHIYWVSFIFIFTLEFWTTALPRVQGYRGRQHVCCGRRLRPPPRPSCRPPPHRPRPAHHISVLFWLVNWLHKCTCSFSFLLHIQHLLLCILPKCTP